MPHLHITWIAGDDLLGTLPPRYFELAKLAEVHRDAKTALNKKVLEEAMAVISQEVPIAQWSAEFSSRFLRMSCYLARLEVTRVEALAKPDTDALEAVNGLADWLCSIGVAARDELDRQVREQVCRLWVMTRLAGGVPDDLEGFVAEATTLLAPVGLSETERGAQVRAQVVMTVSKRLEKGTRIDAQVETARAWCRELVTVPQLNRLLSRVASTLGVEVPRIDEQGAEGAEPPQPPGPPAVAPPVDDAGPKEPRFWKAPELGTERAVQPEYQRCLLKLLALAREPNSALSKPTATRISTDLSPDADFGRWSLAVHHAARDLWAAFGDRGDPAALELARRLALLRYRGAVVAGQERERDRSQALHLWMCTQLPDLIRTCDLAPLLEDAARLWGVLKCAPGDRHLRAGIVQAHAGECRRLRASGDEEGAATLLRENADQLRRVHEDFLAGGKPSEEEGNAWEYLFPPVKAPEAAPLSQQTPTTILGDPGFLDVARSGSHEGIYEFVQARLRDIQELLKRRLDVRLSPEHVMMPEGNIYPDNPANRGQLDPRFADARELLHKGEFNRAAAAFDRLARNLQPRPRNICRNYQAYAQARQGEPVLARGTLIDLPRTRFSYPSAYWNLACCIPSEQNDHRLDVLVSGLENAPHWDLLRGAVYLALILDDEKRLREWLSYLTLTEARLLSYHLHYATMDGAARERVVVQLGRYRAYSEPEVPDPTDHRLAANRMAAFVDQLMELRLEQSIEFWFHCREAVGRNRFDYWQVRTDFLLRSERPRIDAVTAMRQELRCRLEALDSGRMTAPPFVNYTRSRIEEGLRLCMTSELRNVGHDIYNMVNQFDKKYPDMKPLLSRHPQIRRFYDDAGPAGAVRPGGESATKPGDGAPEPGVINAPPVNLDALLAQVGVECTARLHEVAHLPAVRARLDEAAAGLRQHQRPRSADALVRLLREWDSLGQYAAQKDRRAVLQRAQTACAELQGRLQHDLNAQQQILAGQLVIALQRANDRLARDLDLLPRLLVEAPTGSAVVVDPSARVTAFAVRVRAEPGGEGGAPPVRLRGATAVLDDGGTEFPLRDRLAEVPALVSTEQSAVLTFGFVPSAGQAPGRSVRISLSYEFAGSPYTSERFTIPLAFSQSPALPASSPYIFARPLESNEIEGHFFGRAAEQAMLLDSVRDGQQKIRYVEGIRRAGKSSLLHSIEHEIRRRNLPLIPVYWSTTAVTNCDHAGRILFNLLDAVVKHPNVVPLGLAPPPEERCCENLPRAYTDFTRDLADRVGNGRVLVLVDDFQVLVEAANAAERNNPALHRGIVGLLDIIFGSAKPQSRLLWVFAGHRAFRQYRTLLPGPLLWGTMRALAIDFLSLDAVGEIIQAPLSASGVDVPPETVRRAHAHTAGHPEVVQQLAELMLEHARTEARAILTPADADTAAHDLASFSDTFADTWYPMAELTREQRDLIAALVAVVPPGGRINPSRLVPRNAVTEAHKAAIDDLVARKILDHEADGTICIKAYVLDLWLHRAVPRMIQDRANGAVAIFIDVANLTSGKGRAVLTGMDTMAGEGLPGQFSLATVLDRIEHFAHDCSPAPVAARWVVNYPIKSPAVVECNAKDYQVENIPPDLFEKGSDDVVLREKIWEVERQYPTVNHFVLVLGDKDYRITVEKLLQNGKLVHVVSRAAALAKAETKYSYDSLARRYPNHFTLHRLEELLETVTVK